MTQNSYDPYETEESANPLVKALVGMFDSMFKAGRDIGRLERDREVAEERGTEDERAETDDIGY